MLLKSRFKTLLKYSAVSAIILPALSMANLAHAKIETGTNVSDMTVIDSNGVSHNLSDFAGKTVILEWTNHDCPYVKKHYKTQNMQNLQEDATEIGAVWLSIISSAPGTQGHVSGKLANDLTTKRGASPTAVILDPEGTVGQTFSAKTTPHMYVINADQTLVYQGAIDDKPSARHNTVKGATNYVRAALEDMAAGRPVQKAESTPYGCSVKYKS